MEPTPAFWARRQVCVTGGTGFLGWHLVQALRRLGACVRVLGLPPSPGHPVLAAEGVQCFLGDVRDTATVRQAVRGCSVVFHTAGMVSVWGPGLARMHSVHVEGTRQVLAACNPDARIVHTSSVVAVGASRRDELLDEDSHFNLEAFPVDYVHAKRAAEQIALSAAAAGQAVVVVNPAYMVGPEDHERSVMGRLCVRFWKGRLLLAPPGGFNVVDVRDVAIGHLLAAEFGLPGRRYILGGSNLTMPALLSSLAIAGGVKPRYFPVIPEWLLAALGWLAERRANRVGREPYPSRQQVRLSSRNWFYRHDRAGGELGYAPRPLSETLQDTHAWFASIDELKLRGLQRWWMRAPLEQQAA